MAAKILELFHCRLQEAGLKSTRQRDIIVQAFFDVDKHLSVDELLVEARKHAPSIGYATVYRTLKLLVEQGFANPRHFGDGQTRYDPQLDEGQHDHLICVDCGRIIEFDDDGVVERLAELAKQRGFQLSRRKVEIYGICTRKDCPFRDS